ncbi:hypothetical protein ACHAWU_000487 [Discostella pseudostelligera]|uniref:BTB domain-containing protein n=1 Tax=Discostella pseudostelligera TaxID=259834 RepID=A0ABD3MC34_9STRA
MSQHSKGTALGRHTSAVHVGAPPATFLQDFVSTKVYFHGFADLPTENGECVHSPTFFCLGYEWWLSLFPRGEEDDAEYLSIFLRLRSDVCIEIECSFTLGDRISTVKSYDFDGSGASLGFHSAWTRETVLTSYLTNGSFVIEVRIKPKLASPKFIPDNPLTSKDIRSLWFNEEEYADVVFEIVTKVARDGDSNKASTTFYAHRNILRKAAPQLADLASMSKEKPARVEISNVSSRTFRAILSYIYGLAVPKLGQDLTDAKEIIVAADLFGLTNLKLEAEATYVSLLTLTLDNVMEHLHFADSKNCALLKEEVIAFIIKNTVEAVDKKH